MDLHVELDQKLAEQIQASYQAKNYSAAILDAIHHLGELIRNKIGQDLDGVALVGTAFGGAVPPIKVNSFQTESDRDEQKGIEQLLRGIYTGVRNPRSHGKKDDNVETADALLILVNFLLKKIEKGSSTYDIPAIISRVFDEHFVATQQYADLLVNEIPPLKHRPVLMEVFQRRLDGVGMNVSIFCNSLLAKLATDQQTAFWDSVSGELMSANSDQDFRSVIQIAEPSHWRKLSEVSRIRAENRLIKSIKDGRIDLSTRKCVAGTLGTWAVNIAKDFTLQKEYLSVLLGKLRSDQASQRAYCFEYFFSNVKQLKPDPPSQFIHQLIELLKLRDGEAYRALKFVEYQFPWDEEDKWAIGLQDAYNLYKPPSEGIAIVDDDIPF